MICLLDPQEDELLYSVVARTFDSLADVRQSAFFRELFGRQQTTFSLSLPVGLDRFLGNIQPWSAILKLDIIQDLTLYPYYAVFAPETQRRNVIDRMLTGRIVSEIGGYQQYLRAVKGKQYVSICLQCVEMDREKYGVAHYRRQHQLPCAWICQIHGIPLLNTQVSMRNSSKSEINVKITSLENAVEGASLPGWISHLSPSQLSAMNQISQAGGWILKNPIHPKDNAVFRGQYQYYFKLFGYIDDKSQFLVEKINRELEEIFSAEALDHMGCQSSMLSGNDWHSTVSTLSQNRNGRPTINHLILITYLGMTPEIFLKESRALSLASAAYGPPPYQCINKFCPEYMQKNIFEQPITSKGRKTYTFTCLSCNQSYELTPGASIKMALPVFYGDFWDSKLRQLALDKTINRSEACRRLGISVERLRNAAKRLEIRQWMAKSDLEAPMINDLWQKQKQERENTLERHRNLFLHFTNLHPDYTRSQIKKHMHSTSVYLAHYDRDWYEKHAPATVSRRHGLKIKQLDLL